MRFCEFQDKEVINACNCKNLGNVADIELDEKTGCILAIIVPGPCKIFGILGHEYEYWIPWKCIVRIGPDIILVDIKEEDARRKI